MAETAVVANAAPTTKAEQPSQPAAVYAKMKFAFKVKSIKAVLYKGDSNLVSLN